MVATLNGIGKFFYNAIVAKFEKPDFASNCGEGSGGRLKRAY